MLDENTWVGIDPFRRLLWASITHDRELFVPKVRIVWVGDEGACEFFSFRNLRVLILWMSKQKYVNTQAYLGQHHIEYTPHKGWTIHVNELWRRPFDVLRIRFVVWNRNISSIGDLRNSSANVVVKKERNSTIRYGFVAARDKCKYLHATRYVTYTRLSGRSSKRPFLVNCASTRSNR